LADEFPAPEPSNLVNHTTSTDDGVKGRICGVIAAWHRAAGASRAQPIAGRRTKPAPPGMTSWPVQPKPL
jgi:hypothetical protein